MFPDDAWLKEAGIESYLAIPLFDATGGPTGHMGVMDTLPMDESSENEDILRVFAARASSEMVRMRAERDLAESRRMLETLMANLPGMAYRFANDRQRTAEFVSNGCMGLTGYSAWDFTGKKRSYGRDIMHPSDRDAVFMEIRAGIESKGPFKAVYRILPANGRERWVWEQGSAVFSDDGTLQAVEGFITDITETKRAEDRIRTMATFDSLTGLPNRTLFFDRFEKALAYAIRYQHAMAVLFVDLDDFKAVNDNYGHQAGDSLLQDVSSRLSGAIRASDTVARM
ncbi:MAG: diguanylate cyclase, partial [Deltaproteobacteria bacterium]